MAAPPRLNLANDTTRHFIAGGVAVPFAVGGSLVFTPPGGGVYIPLLYWLLGFIFNFGYAATYLAVTVWAFLGLSGARLRAQLRLGDPKNRRQHVFTALAGGSSSSIAIQFSIIAFIGVLTVVISSEYRGDLTVAITTVLGVIGSWTLMTVAFASVYALAWARDNEISLPESREDLAYSDFVYLAVQISTTFAPSGMQMHTRALRRTATIHALVAFCFSTVIVALLVVLISSNTI